MKRKIIKQGHNTLTVTLPSDWVKKLNLKSGDEIDVLENENSLILNGFEKNKEKIKGDLILHKALLSSF